MYFCDKRVNASPTCGYFIVFCTTSFGDVCPSSSFCWSFDFRVAWTPTEKLFNQQQLGGVQTSNSGDRWEAGDLHRRRNWASRLIKRPILLFPKEPSTVYVRDLRKIHSKRTPTCFEIKTLVSSQFLLTTCWYKNFWMTSMVFPLYFIFCLHTQSV